MEKKIQKRDVGIQFCKTELITTKSKTVFLNHFDENVFSHTDFSQRNTMWGELTVILCCFSIDLR